MWSFFTFLDQISAYIAADYRVALYVSFADTFIPFGYGLCCEFHWRTWHSTRHRITDSATSVICAAHLPVDGYVVAYAYRLRRIKVRGRHVDVLAVRVSFGAFKFFFGNYCISWVKRNSSFDTGSAAR